MGKDPVTDTIHQELWTAIAELAKSVDFAVKRMAMRAKFAAAIADAKKTERAAEAFLAAALAGHSAAVQGPAIDPKPALPPRISQSQNIEIVEELDAACRWLSEVATIAPPPKPDTKARTESAFALSLLELHDRTGGFLKTNSNVTRNDAALVNL